MDVKNVSCNFLGKIIDSPLKDNTLDGQSVSNNALIIALFVRELSRDHVVALIVRITVVVRLTVFRVVTWLRFLKTSYCSVHAT